MVDINDELPPWLTPVDDLEGVEGQGVFSGKIKKLVIGLSLLVITVFSVALWVMYDDASDGIEQPIEILADMAPIRVKPEDPGGKHIPDQDKDVYNRIRGGGNENTSTQLAKEAETPVDSLTETLENESQPLVIKDKADKNLPKTDLSVPPIDDKKDGNSSDIVEVRDKPAAPKKRADVGASKNSSLRDRIEAAAAVKNGQPAPKASTAKATSIPRDKFRVQLGAYSSETAAKTFWKNLSKDNPQIFSDMQDEYVPLTRGGRTLYRLRIGPLANRKEADTLCLQLKARQQACMVVTPK